MVLGPVLYESIKSITFALLSIKFAKLPKIPAQNCFLPTLITRGILGRIKAADRLLIRSCVIVLSFIMILSSIFLLTILRYPSISKLLGKTKPPTHTLPLPITAKPLLKSKPATKRSVNCGNFSESIF